jgi:O-antigen ligase
VISLVKAHGIAAAIEPSGMLVIETMGAYLLARCYIRDAEDFASTIVLAAAIIACLLPFAAYEWVTGNRLIISAFRNILPSVETALGEQRMGFWRVQGPFVHPILFGLFCGSIFALTQAVARTKRAGLVRRLLPALVASTALLSMSSAPIAGLVMQGALMSWNGVLRRYRSRWKILWVLMLAGFLVVDFGSNQTPIKFYISHFTFDKATGWFRILIWEYGSASVLNHPLFGIGLGSWARPKWMPDSVDNFWLLTAMRYGIPALVFILGSCLWTLFAIAFKPKLDEKLQSYRVAYLICLVAYLFVGTTVHFWTAAYVWFLFLLGSGVWLLDIKTGDDGAAGRLNRSRPNAQPVSPRGRTRNVFRRPSPS